MDSYVTGVSLRASKGPVDEEDVSSVHSALTGSGFEPIQDLEKEVVSSKSKAQAEDMQDEDWEDLAEAQVCPLWLGLAVVSCVVQPTWQISTVAAFRSQAAGQTALRECSILCLNLHCKYGVQNLLDWSVNVCSRQVTVPLDLFYCQ